MTAQSSAVRAAIDTSGAIVTHPLSPAHESILTPDALAFLAELHRVFEPHRQQLLTSRIAHRRRLDRGERIDFPVETQTLRESEWRVAPIPADLEERRVEITGPVDRKMIINALNSGANVFMADFEDSNSPTSQNILDGQVNLFDAVRRTIEFQNPQGKRYRLNDTVATLMARPRGWHLDEKHVLVDGEPISAALFDFGLFLFHNAQVQIDRGTGPYFYLPKLEHYLEARLWNDVFLHAQRYVGVPRGSIRATVLIETIQAAFQMDEILWELRDHSAGLNCGRWDYIFSFIKAFRSHASCVLPDRALITMDRHFLASYVDLLIQTCHRRGIHAMGGMAAQIPVRDDPEANAAAMARVREDKAREVRAGHDGTWVAHPGLIAVAREEFDAGMSGPNQIDNTRPDVVVTADDLVAVPEGAITERGLRHNIDVGLRYLDAWLGGSGCVPIYNLMEDAATAEISRSQVWQWVSHRTQLQDGRTVTPRLVRTLMADVVSHLTEERMILDEDDQHLSRAAELLEEMMLGETLDEWLTTVAYEYLD